MSGSAASTQRDEIAATMRRMGADSLASELIDSDQHLTWLRSDLGGESVGSDQEWRSAKRADGHIMRRCLMHRLEREGAYDLVAKLDTCGQDMWMTCTGCGGQHKTLTSCKRKWCPACQRAIATKRADRMRSGVKRLKWPLFVTLTMANSYNAESVRTLRRSFGKLRNRKLWKDSVLGGVAAVEVTNKGQGWHPHLHALVDCEWLAIHTPAPQKGDDHQTVERKCEYAQRELSATWADILGQQLAVVWVTRAHGLGVVKEVLKYSVKGSDLLASPDQIAPMLRVLEMTRLVTTFGHLYGTAKELDAENKTEGCACEECGQRGSLLPNSVISYLVRT